MKTLKDFLNEKLDPLREQGQGEYLGPEDEEYYDYEDPELKLADAIQKTLPKMGTDDRIDVDVNRDRGEIELHVIMDEIITVVHMQQLTQIISNIVPVQFIGVSWSGTDFGIHLHFKMQQ